MILNSKNVIFVTGSLTGGGAEKVISILASQCAELGADVTLVVLRNKKHSYKLSSKVKVHQINVGEKKLKIISRIKILRSIFKHSKANTIIAFLPIITMYSLIANIGLHKRIITSERGDPNLNIFSLNLNIKDKISHIIMRKMQLFGLADYVVFQTPDAQSYYNKRIQKKSRVIPNPLDLTNLPNKYNFEREKNIIAAGRFSEEKNFPLLIRAFADFHKAYPDYKLIIYGDGPLKEELKKLIEALELERNVILPGFSDSLLPTMNKASIYISTSNHEGISNSMLEALGMGVPTIATDCPIGGARMFVKTDKNGILIPMNDREKLVNAMVEIVSNTQYSKQLSNNVDSFRNKLSSEVVCEEWLKIVW